MAVGGTVTGASSTIGIVIGGSMVVGTIPVIEESFSMA